MYVGGLWSCEVQNRVDRVLNIRKARDFSLAGGKRNSGVVYFPPPSYAYFLPPLPLLIPTTNEQLGACRTAPPEHDTYNHAKDTANRVVTGTPPT
jgi:hypothetical protein